ncbi:MAG TPA: 2-oxoacid:acceptor oxidoreductase family protein [Spirochaetota bacterium]|nr:2-oxoacid:acceptor oxidoreductase family protein [Spirochaetota bacterium]HOM38974.1 2-oxoacid:acceptor oxidoreductase family protein [Spirochaetota bacterium]HPQ48366.1 2-oxoacid:acceptor oxidoreductase family protein [Spirochaetota bacterium]
MDIIIVGIGGQGTILASKVLCDALVEEGYDVKKSEVHGMSQRGGSVITHVRFSKKKVYSPLIRVNSADIVLSFNEDETRRYSYLAKEDSRVIQLTDEDKKKVFSQSLNMFGLGKLSKLVDVSIDSWYKSFRNNIKKFYDENIKAFEIGRNEGIK